MGDNWAPAVDARSQEMEEIYRLREIEEIRALQQKEEEVRVRKALQGPSVAERVQRKASDVRGQLEPGAVLPALTQAARSVPLVGPVAEKGLRALMDDENESAFDARQADAMRRYPDIMGAATVVGSLGGSLAIPSPAGKMGGLGGGVARVGEGVGTASADAALRDEDPLTSGAMGGAGNMLSEALRIKHYNRVFGGIPDEMQDYYVANRKAVNAARPTEEVGAALTQDARRLQGEISRGSGESFKILRQSGKQYELDTILQSIEKAKARIADGGAFGPGDKALLKHLDDLSSDITAVAQNAGPRAAGPMNTVPPEKVKSFITAYRGITKAYDKGQLGLGHPAGQGYVRGILKEADSEMDSALKQLVPAYDTQMQTVSKATRAIKPLQKQLGDETRSLQFVRRMMRGKDPEGLRALKEFDAAAGTSYASEIPASYTKDFFSRPNINGSRQVNVGRGIGNAVGGPVGEAVGGVVGAAQDVYARKVGKALLDLSMLPILGSSGRLLNKAAQKSPYAAMGMYRFLRERDAAFRTKMDQLLQDEAEGTEGESE